MIYSNPKQSCIEACTKCAQACQNCLNMCLQESDVNRRVDLIKTLLDCSEICVTASCYMSRVSGNIDDILKVCATICDRCAAECTKLNDQHCTVCADECRNCVAECNDLISMTVGR